MWSVCIYIIGPFSGWWWLGGKGQRYLTAPIGKCMSAIGHHQFTFLVDLLSNYTLYKNLTTFFIEWLLMEDVASLITINSQKSLENHLSCGYREKVTNSWNSKFRTEPNLMLSGGNTASNQQALVPTSPKNLEITDTFLWNLVDIRDNINTLHWQIEKLFVLLFVICLIKNLFFNKLIHICDWCIVVLVQCHAMITYERFIN